MKRWMHKLEKLVDHIIPYMLILLLVIIILEIFFKEFVEHNHLHPYIVAADYVVIAVFVADLIFKWIRIRNVKLFLKKAWLDIIAVFPFFIFFRAFEAVAGVFALEFGEAATTVQKVLHEGVEVEKEGAKVLEAIEKEGARAGRVTRSTRFTRFFRIFTRVPRFVKAIPFYAKPTGEHHPHEKISKKKSKKK